MTTPTTELTAAELLRATSAAIRERWPLTAEYDAEASRDHVTWYAVAAGCEGAARHIVELHDSEHPDGCPEVTPWLAVARAYMGRQS